MINWQMHCLTYLPFFEGRTLKIYAVSNVQTHNILLWTPVPIVYDKPFGRNLWLHPLACPSHPQSSSRALEITLRLSVSKFYFWRLHLQACSRGICFPVPGFLHSAGHPPAFSMLLRNGRIFFRVGWWVFSCVYIPQCLYSFLYGWTHRVSLSLGTCEWCYGNMGVQVPVWQAEFTSFGCVPNRRWLDATAILCLIFFETFALFSTITGQIYIPTQDFPSPHIWQYLLSFWL